MRNGGIFWGIILVLLGGLFLLETLGILPANVNVWGVFWPLLLIALGLSALIQALRPGYARAEALRLPLEGARAARVKIGYGAGELMIDDRAGLDELLNGSFGGGVESHTRRSMDETSVELRLPARNLQFFWPPVGPGPRGLNWTIGLNPEVVYRLELEVGASRNRMNLTNLKVSELRLQTGASATEIDFPARAGRTSAVIKAGAAGVEVRVPQGVGVRIHAAGGLAEVNVDTVRFPRTGGGDYRSADYETAANRLDLEIEAGLGSVSVR